MTDLFFFYKIALKSISVFKGQTLLLLMRKMRVYIRSLVFAYDKQTFARHYNRAIQLHLNKMFSLFFPIKSMALCNLFKLK